jgi:hypothetical protein
VATLQLPETFPIAMHVAARIRIVANPATHLRIRIVANPATNLKLP